MSDFHLLRCGMFVQLEDQEKYIDYRFNKISVRRITGLEGKDIDSFMVWYRPTYEFVATADEIKFNQYILNASYQYRRVMDVPAAKKEEWGVRMSFPALQKKPEQKSLSILSHSCTLKGFCSMAIIKA